MTLDDIIRELWIDAEPNATPERVAHILSWNGALSEVQALASATTRSAPNDARNAGQGIGATMTPEEAARRAIALSVLPKWEWSRGMQSIHNDARRCILKTRRFPERGGWLGLDVEGLVAWIDAKHYRAVPDFTDELTVLAMIPLVRRAWTGHDLTITWRDNGNVDLVVGLYADGGARFWVRNVPLYEALTLALEAAPEKP